MKLDTQRISSVARQAGAFAAVLVGILATPPILNLLPPSVSAVMVAVGGALFGIEHHNSAQNGSGAPETPPVAPSTTTDPSVPPTIPRTK